MSSTKILPLPPAVGLARSPTPMYIVLTLARFTPAFAQTLVLTRLSTLTVIEPLPLRRL
jgi:hypothetical protein